ncbi:MAG: hypothetical protein NZL98_11200 [Anaerolineales bacterium]|nr:hypothetical protein [Anaerolineales bacterium]
MPGGLYRVFYLEESGVVLSAEEVFSPSPAQVRAALNGILAQASGFTLDDLEANRRGELTSAQRMKPLGQMLIGIVMIVFALTLIGVLYFSVWPELQSENSSLIPLFIFVFVFGFIGLFGVRTALAGLLDLLFAFLKQVRGVERREEHLRGHRSRSRVYSYVIGGQRFKVSSQAYNALVEGLEYCIYYLPHTYKLLSIEVKEIA